MALTQARAAGAFTSARYGSFAGRGDGEHPVGVLTQARAGAAHVGSRYGSFAGRGAAVGDDRPVGRLTQARTAGAHTGRRYGAFGGRSPAATTDNKVTQARSAAAHTGRRYGAFDGREADPAGPAFFPGGPGRRTQPRPARRHDADDDVLLFLLR